MRLFIPTIGTRLRVTREWSLSLVREYRNSKLWDKIISDVPKTERSTVITIPTGTVITVDRVYIRKGHRGYDSLSFRIHDGDSPDKRFQKSRFFARLEDCNNLECEIDQQVGFAGQDVRYHNVSPGQYGG